MNEEENTEELIIELKEHLTTIGNFIARCEEIVAIIEEKKENGMV